MMKIEFHYTYIIMAISFILCGYLHNLLVFTSIILFHEFGHYLAAKINSFNVEKVIIYPYGGMLKMNNLINSDTNKEILVAISGVVNQLIYYFLVWVLYKNGFIREYIFNLFYIYNKSILFFNILPIYPLDGSKILNLFLYKVIPYNISNKMCIYISFLGLIKVISYYKFNYTNVLIFGLVMNNIIKYYRELKYLFNKFLLERYIYRIRYIRCKRVKKIDYMFKDRYNLIKDINCYVTEREMLKKRFKGL